LQGRCWASGETLQRDFLATWVSLSVLDPVVSKIAKSDLRSRLWGGFSFGHLCDAPCLFMCSFLDAGMTNPSTRCCGFRKAPTHEIAERMRGRCRGRYGDFAAGSGLLRLDCKGCRDRLAAKRGRIGRCERAIWAWRDGIGGGSAGESEVVMRAWSLPAESRQEERVSGRASIADDGIMT
jgi:hypothetical protein